MSSGRWSTGVAHVLSHATRAPTACAASTARRMSVMRSSGLDGVSSQTRRVEGRSASSSAPGTARSAKVTSSPQGWSISRSSEAVPWYASIGATTWSPGRSAWNTASVAAEPDANAAAAAPPSSAASASSSA